MTKTDANKSPEVIDLCLSDSETKPTATTTTTAFRFVDGVFELADDSDNEDQSNSTNQKRDGSAASLSTHSRINENAQKKSKNINPHPGVAPMQAGPTSPAENYDTKPRAVSSEEEDDDKVELVVEPPSSTVPAAASIPPNDDLGGDDLQVLSGSSALMDFPHSRENCVQFPMDKCNPIQHCENCYCYVCDIPAAKCTRWENHSKATHGGSWLRERERVRRAGGPATAFLKAPPASSNLVVSTTGVASFAPSIFANRPDPGEHSIRALLAEVTSIYPLEVNPPSTIQSTLRHYQKQCLAFMQTTEASSDKATEGCISTYSVEGNRGKLLCRGGWLASEVGMGKTCVVLSLAASDGGKVLPPIDANASAERVKATVILTSVSLLGQWEDECKKHAPSLRVVRYHPSSTSAYGQHLTHGNKALALQKIREADIVISSATKSNKLRALLGLDLIFNRVVMDESHLFRTSSAFIGVANSIQAERRWCVTATPCTSSVKELLEQLTFLGLRSKAEWAQAITNFPCGRKEDFYRLSDLLKQVMIRHTKNQQINGTQALALPESTSSVVIVPMNSNEERHYKAGLAGGHHKSYLTRVLATGTKTWVFQNNVLSPLILNSIPSKIAALMKDIKSLQQSDRNMRAVIFTQSSRIHTTCKNATQRAGIKTLEFSGTTSPTKRDQAIRTFQSNEGGSMVFVITARAGGVGITLTSASRVYLLEPWIDPAQEVQSAGRIHRLGQTKKVHVVKFAFAKTFEEKILSLHKEIAAGRLSLPDGELPSEAVKILAERL